MVIRDSLQVLEQISDVEKKIRTVEKMMDDLGIKIDREKLIKAILTRRNSSSGHGLKS